VRPGGTPPFTITSLATAPLPPGLTVAAAGDVIRVTGSPLRAGLQLAGFEVRDAAGRALTEWMSLNVLDLGFTKTDLLDALIHSSGTSIISPTARGYLDNSGNRNGPFDIGDARAYLKRNGQL
jgi:hypothetical protein